MQLHAQAGFFSDADTTVTILPSLDEVINDALQNSPLLKSIGVESDMIGQELKIEKKKWSDHIYVDGAANYGLFDQVVISETSSQHVTNTGLLTKSEQIRYYGGISIKLPLSSIGSRRNQLTVKKMELQQTNYEMQQQEMALREIIINAYFSVKHLEESMNTFQAIFQTLQLAYIKAENDVVNNDMEMEEFAILASTVGKAKDDYSKSKYDFYKEYYILQNITGVSFGIK